MDFAQWLDLTNAEQRETYGYHFDKMSSEELARYVMMSALGAKVELSEALGEVQWKPWSKNIGKLIDRDKYVEELVDVLHFTANLLIVFGVTGEELSKAYMAKVEVNRLRQLEGYDASTR